MRICNYDGEYMCEYTVEFGTFMRHTIHQFDYAIVMTLQGVICVWTFAYA